jgi:hypothetical protein
MLLFDLQASLRQALRKGVLINFFEMTVRVINMNGVSHLPNLVA